GALGRRRPLARRGYGREPRELRGADQNRPRRAADPHLPADPLDDALAESAPRRDPLGARVLGRRVGVARRHRGRARRGGDLLHADARARPRGGREGDRRRLLRAAHLGARGRAARGRRAREDRAEARSRARGHRDVRDDTVSAMPQLAESSLNLASEFPILAQRPGGRPLVYLDAASTSQKPRAVLDAMNEHYSKHNANVHRGLYSIAREADAAYQHARARVAAFTGASERATIFTKNVTEAINLVAYAWGRANVGAGDAVLITQMEHHANVVPWQMLCR